MDHSPTTPSTPAAPAPPTGRPALDPRKARKRRRRRFVVRVIAGAILGLPIVVLILTQGPVAAWVMGRLVRSQLGADFSADWVSLKPDGRLVVNKAVLRAPGMPGPEGQIASAESVEIDLDIGGLFGLNVRPHEIKLTQPVFRLSRGEKGDLNIAGLVIPKSSGGMSSVPQIVVDHGGLEFAEHRPGASAEGERFRILARAEVSGTIKPERPGSDEYLIDFKQVGGSPMGVGNREVQVSGRMNLKQGDGTLSISGLDLGKWTKDRVPTDLAPMWTQLGMQGEVTKTDIRFTRQGNLETTLKLKGVALNVPLPRGQPEFVGSSTLLMTDVAGEIEFYQRASGSGIEARLEGFYDDDDLRVQVEFRSSGVSIDSPYVATLTARDFSFANSSRILWLAPQSAREVMDMFSGPSAIVDAQIRVEQGAPVDGSRPDPVIRGKLAFQRGSAAFAPFPYRFDSLAGNVDFDDQSVNITSISGVGPTGATILATGVVTPLTDAASVHINVDLYNVPFDRYLEEAVSKSRGQDLLSAIFSKDRYREIVERGLVVPGHPARPEDATRQRMGAAMMASAGSPSRRFLDVLLGGAVDQRQTPVFGLDGRVREIHIRVDRPYGEKEDYQQDIDVQFEWLTLLPEVFAYPMIGTNVRLRIQNDVATVTCEDIRGLEGGAATLDATVQMVNMEEDEKKPPVMAYLPTVDVTARRIPVTPLLVHAVPDDAARALSGPAKAARREAGTADGVSPQKILRGLGIRGQVDCAASVRPRGPDEVRFQVNVEFADLLAEPVDQSGPTRVAAAGVTGALAVSQDGLTVEKITGELFTAQAAEPAEPADSAHPGAPPATGDRGSEIAGPPRAAGRFSLSAHTQFGDPARGVQSDLWATLASGDLDVSTPVEAFARVLDTGVAQTIIDLRREYRPSGRISGEVNVATLRPDAPPGADGAVPADASNASGLTSVVLGLSAADDLQLDALGGRVQVQQQRGAVSARVVRGAGVMTPGGAGAASSPLLGGTLLTFTNFQAEVGMDGARSATLQLDGSVRLVDKTAPAGAIEGGKTQPEGVTMLVDAPLRGMVAGGVIHTPLTRAVVGVMGGERATRIMDELSLRGLLDADFVLQPVVDREGQAPRGDWTLHAAVWPTFLALSSDEVSVYIPRVRGRFTIDGSRGTIDGLELDTYDWNVILDGEWTLAPRGESGTSPAGPVLDDQAPGAPAEPLASARISMWFTAEELTPSLLALAPSSVRDALQGIDLRAPGGLDMQGAELSVALGAQGLQTLDFDGELNFADASAQVGLSLSDTTGSARVHVLKGGADEPLRVALDLAAQTLRIESVDVLDARARVLTSPDGSSVELPLFEGSCYGGRIAGSARLFDEASGLPGAQPEASAKRRRYEARVQVGGVRVGDMLLALKKTAHSPRVAEASLGVFQPGERPEGETPQPREGAGDERRGWMDAELSLSGAVGDARDRQGRGAMRITGGDVLDMPLVVRLLQLGNLQLPLGGTMDYFHASFFMDGPRVTFDQLGVLSGTLAIMGTGEMTIPGMDLDLTVSTQSRLRLPLVSDLFEIVRNEIVTARVLGTVDAPAIVPEPLRGTRTILGGLLGAPGSTLPGVSREHLERERDRSPFVAPTTMPEASTTP